MIIREALQGTHKSFLSMLWELLHHECSQSILNNPIDLTTESSSEQLQFNIPLGAIIAESVVATDLSRIYYTKPQTDTQISHSVALKKLIKHM